MLVTTNHEGLPLAIDTDEWLIGLSVFIPTLQPAETGSKLAKLLKKEQPSWSVVYKTAFHDGKYGVKLWRMS